MNTLTILNNKLKYFNENNDIKFDIDTIRVTFSRQHKLSKLMSIGRWHKLQKNSNILHKLKNRLEAEEITTAHQLEDLNIYIYNSNKDKPKYRKATLVIFGMKQYHKEPPPQKVIDKLLNILTFGNSKHNSSIDICYDTDKKPCIGNLETFFDVKNYNKKGIKTDTFYLNETHEQMIEKVCIYNKAFKNELDCTMWRIEATVRVPDIKKSSLHLDEFKNIIELARG